MRYFFPEKGLLELQFYVTILCINCTLLLKGGKHIGKIFLKETC